MSIDKKSGLFHNLIIQPAPEPFGLIPLPNWLVVFGAEAMRFLARDPEHYCHSYCRIPVLASEMIREELVGRIARILRSVAVQGIRVRDVTRYGWEDNAGKARMNEDIHRVILSDRDQVLLLEHGERAAEIALQAIEAYIAHVADGGDPSADFTPVFGPKKTE